MKRILSILTVLTWSWMGQASIIVDVQEGEAIPAGASGFVSTATLSGLAGTIQNLSVNLNISGAPNGDLYAYLSHGDGFTVLLNRVGSTASDPLGYRDVGLNVTLVSNGADVHNYQLAGVPVTSPLTGTWGVDGRNVNPYTAIDTDPRSAFLSSFIGSDPNGEWRLFVANVGGGGTAVLESWGMEMNSPSGPEVSVVPEASTWIAGAACLALLGLTIVRKRTSIPVSTSVGPASHP